MENCSKSCLEDCNCGVASYDSTYCSKQQLPLRYLRNISFISNDYYDTDKKTIFFKVGKIKSLNLTRHVNEQKVPKVVSVGWYKKDWCIALVILFSCTGFAISGFYMFRIRELRYIRLREQNGILGVTNEKPTLRVFSCNDLKRATNGFKHEIGKGGFGTVYKGALNKGREVVAVKMLKKPELDDNEREFRTELRTIGRTNHRNLVRLLGFCLEKSKRLLVYEYISNGYLADLIFNEAVRRPDWDERVRIAIDVARGVLYLHEECKDPIIHCDIKPQNILMDDSGTAKICDFGLAKLLMADHTRTLTRLRGTLGYVAPEWQKINNPISVKADVYSYGIVLMEIVCCRKMYDPVNVSDPEEIVLSSWVYKCFAARELHKLVTDDEEVNIKTFENMVKVWNYHFFKPAITVDLLTDFVYS
ncbi:hypothetical protein TIFTF001_011516 [Ficus carica]|uniref:non-specific serine/threonine protein kinase n=1 Tax=Ficus carica TaxID=3494 RepID=A0AA87ZRX6_FICCA|nr:hypothetical protein TIFTF001_011516 [Ficus carica]